MNKLNTIPVSSHLITIRHDDLGKCHVSMFVTPDGRTIYNFVPINDPKTGLPVTAGERKAKDDKFVELLGYIVV